MVLLHPGAQAVSQAHDFDVESSWRHKPVPPVLQRRPQAGQRSIRPALLGFHPHLDGDHLAFQAGQVGQHQPLKRRAI
eukprot:128779-Chlamydomonas_euryale.AAC.1